MTEFTFTVAITDEQIERAIARSTTTSFYDPEDEEWSDQPMNLGALVNKAVGDRIDKAIAEVVPGIVRELVEARVLKALDDGFPTHERWGERNGTKTLTEIVGEMVFRKTDHYGGGFDMHKFIRQEATNHAKTIVAEAAKKAGAEIDALFKDAAAEGLATMLKRKLGVKV